MHPRRIHRRCRSRRGRLGCLSRPSPGRRHGSRRRSRSRTPLPRHPSHSRHRRQRPRRRHRSRQAAATFPSRQSQHLRRPLSRVSRARASPHGKLCSSRTWTGTRRSPRPRPQRTGRMRNGLHGQSAEERLPARATPPRRAPSRPCPRARTFPPQCSGPQPRWAVRRSRFPTRARPTVRGSHWRTSTLTWINTGPTRLRWPPCRRWTRAGMRQPRMPPACTRPEFASAGPGPAGWRQCPRRRPASFPRRSERATSG